MGKGHEGGGWGIFQSAALQPADGVAQTHRPEDASGCCRKRHPAPSPRGESSKNSAARVPDGPGEDLAYKHPNKKSRIKQNKKFNMQKNANESALEEDVKQ